VRERRFLPTTDFERLAETDTVNICVPTPLRKTRDPDVSYIVQATAEVKKRLHAQQLIMLESTTYPGTTEELLLPEFEATGLKVGRDFFLGFSPERVDPGNPRFQTKNIPKVVGGVTEQCRQVACALYRTSIDTVIPVSSPQVAEMVKLLENTFRSVNIGLVNELALLCRKMNLDVWEVIAAAATKPFGFMPFYPGPGLGGHCIPVDPFYLSWKARAAGFEARFIELAGVVNGEMPEHVGRLVTEALNRNERSVKGSRVLILGIAYKADIDDVRESPALDVIQILKRLGAAVTYHDPFVPTVRIDDETVRSVALDEQTLQATHCVVVTTAHSGIDYGWVLEHSAAMVDTRNCLPHRSDPKLLRL
jgi:UDP-N-acetyl-D-glucosamine dehydrogenase